MASLVATTEEEKPTADDTPTTSRDHDLDINQMENIDRQKFLHINTEKEDKFDTFVEWIQSNGGNFPKLYLKKYVPNHQLKLLYIFF